MGTWTGFGITGAFNFGLFAQMGGLFSTDYLPHRFCYLSSPDLVWTNVTMDGLIALSYGVISVCLFLVAARLRRMGPMRLYIRIFAGFGVFILACGVTHVMEVVTVWWPVYPLAAFFKVACAVASISTAVLLARATPRLAGNIEGVLASIARSQRESQDEAANYREQVEAINRSQMMIEFAMDGTILKVNENYLRAYGFDEIDMTGKDHSAFVTEEYKHSQEYKDFWVALRAGRHQTGQFCRTAKDGHPLWIEASFNPILGPDGVPIKVVEFASDVTDRVKGQSDLKDAKARLRVLLDNVVDGIISIDGGGSILAINPAVTKMFGYQAEEVIGQNIKMLMPEPTRGQHDGHLANYHPGEASRTIGVGREMEGLTKSHGTFPMELTISEVSFHGQRMFVGLIRDITVGKYQQEALRKTKEILDRTGRLAGVGGWEIDLITEEVTWSDETAYLMGVRPDYRPTLAAGIEFYAPEARPKIRLAIEKAIAEKRGFELDAPLIRADGRQIWVRVTASLEFVDGKPVRMIGAFQDITVRVAEQVALQAANTRAALATESSGIGIWSWDIATDILSWDSWMYRLYGLDVRNDQRETYEIWTSYLHPGDRETTEQALRDCVEGVKPYDTVFRVVWDDGSIHHIRACGKVEHNEKGHALRVVGANWDVTALIQANERSREALEIAKDSSRTKSDFLANMSHEIRTPMNAVLGLAHLALRSELTPKQHGYLTKISTAARALLGIMNDILDFSKIEAGKLEMERISFSLDEVLRNLADIVGQKARHKGLALVFDVTPGTPPFLVGDPLRLGQILINLVNNAVKFTDAGRIVVRVSAETIPIEAVRLTISVSDTGIGMSAEQVVNLFQPFNQADTSFTRRYGGTGLGLAISKQLCELMEGEIRVESELGRGSTFHVTASLGIGSGAIAEFATGRSNSGEAQSVLVVDDSESTRIVLISMLESMGFLSRGVASGEEALSAIAHAYQIGRPIDLVLMDWRLPGMDGMDASRRIKSQAGAVRIPQILMISGFEREEVMSGAGASSFDGFLSKPVTEANLRAAVAVALGAAGEDPRLRLPQSSRAPATSLKGKHVLLVEDNEINRELAMELLTDVGIEVTVAVNGQDGVDKIAAGNFDLVLMDIQMPVMDGLTATRLIRGDSRFQKLPILAMTAHAMSGDRDRSLQTGMNDHITKPINPDSLIDMLVRWMPQAEAPKRPPQAVLPLAAFSLDSIPDELLPFDIQAALVRANGKAKLLRKMMRRFREQYADTASELRVQIASGNVEDAHRLAHSLKGVAATLEAKDLSAAAARVEHALRDGLVQSLDALIEAMDAALTPAIVAATSLEEPASAA